MSRFDAYIGLPWKNRGRDRAGVDCWGLTRIIYKECLEIALPDLANVYVDAGDRPTVRAAVESQRLDWIAMPVHKVYDLVLIRQAPWHVGIVAGRGLMLHVPENGESCIERYTGGRWGDRIEGVYRHWWMADQLREEFVA